MINSSILHILLLLFTLFGILLVIQLIQFSCFVYLYSCLKHFLQYFFFWKEFWELFKLNKLLTIKVEIVKNTIIEYKIEPWVFSNPESNKQSVPEAAVRRCSSKWMFLKISQYSQKNTCVGVLFLIRSQAFRPATLVKRYSVAVSWLRE